MTILVFSLLHPAWGAKEWTLQECIDYALTHSISLKKAQANSRSAAIDVAEKRAQWLPTLSASLSEGGSWRPFQETAINTVNGGVSTASMKKTSATGSYGINAGWMVYNGGQRQMGIQSAEISQQRSILAESQQQNALIEQIAKLYVQILYMEEAARVNSEILHQDSLIWVRGQQFMENGKLARAAVLELEATVASGRYDLVNTRTQIAQAKLQLSQLLELPPGETLEVSPVAASDDLVLMAIPPKDRVYESALGQRPEIKDAQLSIEQSQLATRMARAAYIPSISLNAGVNDSHMTGAVNSMGQQLKNNLNAVIGVGVSIPILDQRRTRSSVERAKVGEVTAALNLDDARKVLYQNIEQYWLTATNSQQKYLASRSNVASREASYELLDEQFKVGLKNISDLLQSRSALLLSRQALLQDKYTAILNRSLLSFYAGETMEW